MVNRLLIVAPNDVFRRSLYDWLKLHLVDCSLVAAADLDEAVHLVGNPGLRGVVIDIDLLGLNAIRLLHRVAPQVPKVVLGFGGAAIHRQGVIEAGASAYLQKDNLVEELLPLLQDVVGEGCSVRDGVSVGDRAGGVRLQLFGTMQVLLDGQQVSDFISIKVPVLLAYLAVTARAHSRTSLAGLLWSDVPETNARKSLSMALSNLRQLEIPGLEISRRTVGFASGKVPWLDVDLFCRRVEEGLAVSPDELLASEAKHLEAGVALYRGDLLEGIQVRGAPVFEEWVLVERERLRLMLFRALYTLADYYLACEEYGRGVESMSHLLTIDPWQEVAHRQLMRLLAFDGQYGAALSQYETCCRTLDQQLGVEPEDQTTKLYERIRVLSQQAERTLPSPAIDMRFGPANGLQAPAR